MSRYDDPLHDQRAEMNDIRGLTEFDEYQAVKDKS